MCKDAGGRPVLTARSELGVRLIYGTIIPFGLKQSVVVLLEDTILYLLPANQKAK